MATIDYRRFRKSKLMPEIKKDVFYGVNSENRADNIQRIFKYNDMYAKLQNFRQIRQRNYNYTFGRQWSDKTDIADSNGNYITEEQHIKNQGKVPLKNNMIRPLVKTLLGVYRGNKTKPSVIPRDRVEQSVNDMMSIALEYAYDTNELYELDARTFEEFINSGFCVQSIRWKWNRTKLMWDAYVSQENPALCFFNGDMMDVRGDDLNTFGVIRDLKIADILESFARTPDEAQRIRDIYSNINDNLPQAYDAFDSKRFDANGSFLTPADINKCRLIEAWQLESEQRLRVHDTLTGTQYVLKLDQLKNIEIINKKRIEDALLQGVEEEDVLLMEYEWFIDQFWYVRYVTPTGETLFEGETRFDHKEHPFVFKAYPMINGEVHSFVEDIIDQQRYINRLVTMVDFIMGASAKGVLVFPEEALGSQSKEEILEEWVKYNGVIFAKVKNGAQMPQQIATNATNVGAYELINLQMKLLTEISGVHGALQGKSASSGTPAALYAQESQNASTNLLDLLESFNNFIKKRNYKLMKVIQQYYDSKRYLNIAGTDYENESKWYDPDKVRNVEFDSVITDSANTPAYRMVMNNFLLELYKNQAFDIKVLMENSSYPFADKILRSISKREEEMASMQAGQPPQIPAELQQGANPQAMSLLNQAMM